MKNSDKKVNVGAFSIEKKAAFRGEWGLLTIREFIITKINHPTLYSKTET